MTSARNLLAALLSIALVLGPNAPLFAQDEYDEETIAKVNDHFAKGEEHFYNENYPAAIKEFEAANDLIPNAILMYNISVAHERLGNEEEALEYAERAEADGGLGPDEAAENRARINQFKEAQAQREKEEQQARTDALFTFTKWGWIGTGATVLGGFMLINVALIDGRLADEVEAYKQAAADRNRSEYDALREEIKSRQNGARALFVLGTLFVVGGVGLIVYDLKFNPDNQSDGGVQPAGNDVEVSVSPTPDGLFGTLRVTF